MRYLDGEMSVAERASTAEHLLQCPECAADLVVYFRTGRIDAGCDGVPVPTDTATISAKAAAAATFRMP